MSGGHDETAGVWKIERLAGLCDGIFAIAMTLLVLDLKVPPIPDSLAPTELPRELVALQPKLVSYVVSFVILGGYWMNHHIQTAYLRRVDAILLWMNLFFLMSIAAIPFSASLLGEHPEVRIALIIYGGNVAAAGLLLYWQWRYAVRGGRLVDPDLGPEIIRAHTRRTLLKPAIYLLGMLLALFSVSLSLWTFVLFPLAYGLWIRTTRQ